MNGQTIVDKSYMAQLYEDSFILKQIRRVIEEDKCEYGYSHPTKICIDTLLNIKRERKKDRHRLADHVAAKKVEKKKV